MAYLKPQSPLKKGEDHIYPLTTYDQIIMANGSRWDGKSSSGSASILASRAEVVLPANNWVGMNNTEEPPYYINCSVPKILEEDLYSVDVNMDAVNVDNYSEYLENYALITRTLSEDGIVKFMCYGEKPTIDLTINVHFIHKIGDSLTFAEDGEF